MTQFQSPSALLGLAQDMILKGWQPVWCPQRQSGSFSPEAGCTGGVEYPTVLPQPAVAHKLAFRPPPNVIAIDVDHYEDKHGEDTLMRAEAWLGELPMTFRVTSRGYSNPSGRYLFRIPADLTVTDSSLYQFADPGTGKTDIEIVRTGHRFSWAPGDYHFKNDQLIQCWDEEGTLCELPVVTDLPELPEKWVAYFRNPPVPQSREAYTRPSDGAEWWLSQADSSLGSDAELSSFAYNMLLSRVSEEEIWEQWQRVAVDLDPARPWERSDFDRHMGSRAQNKAADVLARQDHEYQYALNTPGMTEERLREIAEGNARAYELRQAVTASVEVPFNTEVLQRYADRAGITLPADGDDEDEQLVDVELAVRAQPGYQQLLWQELMRTFARREAAKMLQGKFDGFEDISALEAPPDPALLLVTGKDSPATAVIAPKTVTVLSGHRASGKTWISAMWAAQVIRAGGHVLWLDFERQPHGLMQKLSATGLPKHMIAHQLHYTSRLPGVDVLTADITRYKGYGRPVLFVVDAFRGLQNTLSPEASAYDGDAVERVYLEYLNPCSEAGATICLLDHIAKNGNGSTFGSERKESAADVVIKVEQLAPFTKTVPGFSSMEVTKDRYGVIAAGSMAGYLWMPGDGSKSGSSIEQYPSGPELRNWSPRESEEAAAVELSHKGQREVAVAQVVADNPLQFGPRELGRHVQSVYPELFPSAKAATDFAGRMCKEGKLLKEDGPQGKYDVPRVNLSSAAAIDLTAMVGDGE
jgi:hypothetical protein